MLQSTGGKVAGHDLASEQQQKALSAVILFSWPFFTGDGEGSHGCILWAHQMSVSRPDSFLVCKHTHS